MQQRSDLNVLFILIDPLRADRLGSYGYERDTSPRLDRLAAGGVRFGRQLSQSSWTKCSMASLWTGLYPTRTGVTRFDDMLPEEAEMPAEILKRAGFRTVALYRNGWVSPNFGFAQGFDVYTRPTPGPMRDGLRQASPTLKRAGTDDSAIRAAMEYLRVNGDERWFLYLHFMDVHEYTYDEESALFGGEYSDISDNAIRHTDPGIGFLLDQLAQQGYADNTLVVIAADHGEAFRERGLEGHARRVYRETTEVPFLIAFPFRLERGVVVEERTRNVDIWPTVLDLLGLSPAAGLDGRALLAGNGAGSGEAEIAAEPRTGYAYLDTHWGRPNEKPLPTVAVTQGSHRYVLVDDGLGPRELLFDAEKDPRELENRSAADPETLARLRDLANAYLELEPPWGEAPTRDLSEMELNQLRALGYAIP